MAGTYTQLLPTLPTGHVPIMIRGTLDEPFINHCLQAEFGRVAIQTVWTDRHHNSSGGKLAGFLGMQVETLALWYGANQERLLKDDTQGTISRAVILSNEDGSFDEVYATMLGNWAERLRLDLGLKNDRVRAVFARQPYQKNNVGSIRLRPRPNHYTYMAPVSSSSGSSGSALPSATTAAPVSASPCPYPCASSCSCPCASSCSCPCASSCSCPCASFCSCSWTSSCSLSWTSSCSLSWTSSCSRSWTSLGTSTFFLQRMPPEIQLIVFDAALLKPSIHFFKAGFKWNATSTMWHIKFDQFRKDIDTSGYRFQEELAAICPTAECPVSKSSLTRATTFYRHHARARPSQFRYLRQWGRRHGTRTRDRTG
jgi:hypothetical protein